MSAEPPLSSPALADHGADIDLQDHKAAFALKFCRGRDVLNLACGEDDPGFYRGPYWLHKAIAAAAKTVVGLDRNAEAVRVIRTAGYDAVVADAECFALGRTFDVIVASDIIERIEDFRGFLQSCKSHLRPDGRLLVSTANPWNWRNIVKAALSKEVRSSREQSCWVCPSTLRQLFDRHGMTVAEIRFGSRHWRDRAMPLPAPWKHSSFHAETLVRV